jgi:hypothetical protein
MADKHASPAVFDPRPDFGDFYIVTRVQKVLFPSPTERPVTDRDTSVARVRKEKTLVVKALAILVGAVADRHHPYLRLHENLLVLPRFDLLRHCPEVLFVLHEPPLCFCCDEIPGPEIFVVWFGRTLYFY